MKSFLNAPRVLFATLLMCPYLALASYGQMTLDFPPLFYFVAAAVFALPGMVLIVIMESIGDRHRPPAWIGYLALFGISACLFQMFSKSSLVQVPPPAYLTPLPVLGNLVLLSIEPDRSIRKLLAWTVSAAGVAASFLVLAYFNPEKSLKVEDLAMMLLGGTIASMLGWHLGNFIARQRHAKAKRCED